jgi:hypothetical protein
VAVSFCVSVTVEFDVAVVVSVDCSVEFELPDELQPARPATTALPITWRVLRLGWSDFLPIGNGVAVAA